MCETWEDLVGDIMLGSCLGHNDHVTVELNISAVRRKKVSRIATHDFKSAN